MTFGPPGLEHYILKDYDYMLRDEYGNHVSPETIREVYFHRDADAPSVEHISDTVLREAARLLRVRQRELMETIWGDSPTWIGPRPSDQFHEMDHARSAAVGEEQARLRAQNDHEHAEGIRA